MKIRNVLLLLLAAALVFALAACGEGILPPKEGVESTPTPMPTPTPTPTPTPYSGEIASVEVSQAWDEEGALFATDELAEGRDTAVFVWLSSPLGHTPDERDSLAVGRGSEIVGVYAADATSTADCLRFFITGEDAAALTAGEYTFSAVVDGAQFNRRALVHETRALRVLAVPVLANFGGATSYPTESVQAALDRLQREFPLTNGGLNAVTAPGLTLSAESYDLRTNSGLVLAWEALRARAGLLDGYDLILGFVSGGMGESGELGVFGRDGVALLDLSRADCGDALCRFAAGALGVPEIQDGAWRWQTLLAQLSAPQPEVEWVGPVCLNGLLFPDGSVSLRAPMTEPVFAAGRTATPTGEGSYALVFGDEDGTVLRRVAFTPDFSWQLDGATMLDAAPLELIAQVPAGATTLRLVGPVQDEESEEPTEGELFFALLPAEPYESTFTAVPGVESLRGTARVEWDTVLTREEEAEDAGEDGENEEEAPAPELPEPYYELYMCYGDAQLLVYRGSLRYAELDMPSLPKPEYFSFRLLTCGGRTASVTESPELSMN